MDFGFALDLSDIDLLCVDLLDQRYAHLDLFVSKTSWRRLQDMSSKNHQDMSSRRLQDVFSVTIFRLPRRLLDVFMTFCEMSSRRFQDVFARRLGRRKIVTLKTCWRHVLKTCWRPTNVYWDAPLDKVVILIVNEILKKDQLRFG